MFAGALVSPKGMTISNEIYLTEADWFKPLPGLVSDVPVLKSCNRHTSMKARDELQVFGADSVVLKHVEIPVFKPMK